MMSSLLSLVPLKVSSSCHLRDFIIFFASDLNLHSALCCCRNAAGLRGVDVVILGAVFGAVLQRRGAPSYPLHPVETC